MPSEFVHLHVHTEFSLLDGQSRIKTLIQRAQALDMPAVGISDHGVMFGIIDFYRAAKAAGIKPVLGMEAYLAPRKRTDKDANLDKRPFHMLLFAQNDVGYQNLMRLASIAQLEGYYYRPRIDWEVMSQYSEGIIATSGCLAAEIPRLVEDGKDDEAKQKIGQYLDVFGEDNFYLELQPHKIDQLGVLNDWLYEYRKSNHTNVQLYASNDVHYVYKEDADVHDTLLCIQTGAHKAEENRMRMNPADSYYMKSASEMREEFLKQGMPEDMIAEAFANSLKIADMTDVNLDDKGYHLPIFPVPKDFEDEAAYLRYLCEMGLSWRYPGRENDPVLRERLDYELGVVGGMGFNTYFLIVWDLCEFARDVDIWWNVRGSGAGSLVAYCLGITNIDPIQNSLLFERFLNPGRVSMPDIDLDYPDDRRAEMIAYAADKYGKDKVAAIITFGTMGAKAAVKDVGRALDVDSAKVNYATSLIPQEARQKKIAEYIELNPELQDLYNKDRDIKRVMDAAIQLQGMTRHASTHAAGVIIGDRPLYEYAPLHRITGTDPSGGSLEAVTQFPMETAESIGLLKVDFLGLSTLTILRKACDLINKHHGTNYTMDNIPYRHDNTSRDLTEDEIRMLNETFEMMGRGETIGVFQVESGGMQSMLRGMRPQRFQHVVAGISLYRPGPMDFIPAFNRRLHGEEETPYKHEKLIPILEETFGICVTGDTIVFNSNTGQPHRIDEIESQVDQFCIQGVDEDNNTVVSRVTHWFDNGVKPVYQIRLRNGSTIKATADHQFLTEKGWIALQDLQKGSYIATPTSLVEPSQPIKYNRDKLRILAYLLADGGLSNLAQINFYNKEQDVIDEYLRALEVFDDVRPSILTQQRGVKRIASVHKDGRYVTSILAWMRELSLKHPSGSRPGGVRSHEKFIPDFVFQLNNDDVAFFLASLWDCDGYMNPSMCHYKTISYDLAYGVQTLLLRLGIHSVIHANDYENEIKGNRTSYQVTVYDTVPFAQMIQAYMVGRKREIVCETYSTSTINRTDFIEEAKSITQMSARAMMAEYGIDCQHFYAKGRKRERISSGVVQQIAEQAVLPQTLSRLKINWESIESIEPVGEERVYDITVDGIHNFVANNIIVHNCVYQEQIMQIAGQLFEYELGEADLMRKAVSKKKAEALKQHKDIFIERGPKNGVPVDVAEAIFDEIEFFANYGFNKCLVSSTEIVDAATGRMVTIGELYEEKAQVSETLTCDVDNLKLKNGKITDVMFNGVKPVFRLTTQTGREIEATGNHPFYTFDGWRNLEDLTQGDKIAVPRSIPVEGNKEWDEQQIQTFVNEFETIEDDSVYELSNESLKQLLGHFVNERGFKIQGFGLILAIDSKARDKAKQLQHLLLRIGVNSKQTLSHFRADDPLESRWVYQLYIKDTEEIQRLLHAIGLYLLVEQREKIEQLIQIPVAAGGTEYVEEPENDIYWDTIKSIEYIGEEPTYDLTIEGTHNFVANDIIVHNSHASDYAVITVQTAYLKCHYPAEFMTALLSVQFDNIEKVATFLEECRRLEIPVLPPHVNYSAVDFDIEPTDDGKRGIRFGMGAIKNASVGALQHIIDERAANGRFTSLVDFCHRVDLSQVGKRTVESLIKVGALGSWGERDDLHYALEQIVGFSADYHKAKNSGQMSLFGEATGIEETLQIPEAPKKKKVSRREQLGWEKDLMGLYVSGRPVDRHVKTFRAMGNLSIISQLKDPEIITKQDEQVKVAGEVVGLRKVTTKKNDQMAIMNFEDWHESAGVIEVVLFPRTWEESRKYVSDYKRERAEANGEEITEDTRFELEEGDIIVVHGKFDNSRDSAQIICDKITFDFEAMTADEVSSILDYSRDDEPHWMNGYSSQEEPPPPDFYDEETGEMLQSEPPSPVPITNVAPATMGGSVQTPSVEPRFGAQQEEQPAWANGNGHSVEDSNFIDFGMNQDEERVPVHISVCFDRSSDPNRDRRRLRRIHNTLVGYPGKDSFSIVIQAGKKSSIMDFPNHTTGLCDDLLRDLEAIVGRDDIHLEEKA